MQRKKRIEARRFINDIRSGYSDSKLMDKYRLSSSELMRLYRKLILEVTVGYGLRNSRLSSREGAGSYHLRKFPRCYLAVCLRVFDPESLKVQGRVRDISEKGLQLVGVTSQVGEVRDFLIRAEEFSEVRPFEFRATCRWGSNDVIPGEYTAGFEITDISEGCLYELRKLTPSQSC
jgi:PilZ domain